MVFFVRFSKMSVMWFFWALVSLIGSTVWYVFPKFIPIKNPFSLLFFWALVSLIPLLVLSKVFYGQWLNVSDWKYGLFYLLASFGTIGLILSLNYGGKLSIVSLICEFSVVLSVLIGVFVFRESLNLWQILGVGLMILGLGLVLYFER